jgi:hypothetical protein
MKAIIANTIATAPKPIFVKGVTFLLRPDRFFVVVVVVAVVVAVVVFGKYEYNISNIIPVATLSTPIVNNVIESSKIRVFSARTEYPTTNKRIMDNVTDIMPPPICKARNQAGGG